MKKQNKLKSFLAGMMFGIGSLFPAACFNSDVQAATPKPVYGVCYSPFRNGQSPETGIFPTVTQEREDLDIVKNFSKVCRTYGNDAGALFRIPEFCSERGIWCYIGTWISDDATWNQGVIDRLLQVDAKKYAIAKAFLVGNEYLLWRNWNSETTLINLINQMQANTTVPISTAETYNIWLQHPNLVNACDFIGAHIHPYWEGVSIGNAARHVIDKCNLLKQTYPGKEVVILEVGWPSAGPAYGSAVPSAANQKRFLREFIPLAKQNDIKYFIFQAFDEPWKIKYGEVEGHWGLFTDSRILKTGLDTIVYANQADVNFDGKVNKLDLMEVSYDWMLKSGAGGPYFPGDLDQDRKTNMNDLAVISSNWMKVQ